MTKIVGIKALNRSARIRVPDANNSYAKTTLSTESATLVDLDDPATRRALAYHRAIGQWAVIGAENIVNETEILPENTANNTYVALRSLNRASKVRVPADIKVDGPVIGVYTDDPAWVADGDLSDNVYYYVVTAVGDDGETTASSEVNAEVNSSTLTTNITTDTQGYAGVECVLIVTVTADGGTFTLTIGENTTNPIAFDATGAEVEAALETDLGVPATTSVSGNGPYTITFPATEGDVTMTADGSGLTGEGAGVDVTTDTVGELATNETQIVTITDALGGTFTLSFDGYTTDPIDVGADASTVQSILEGLTSIGSGNVTVSLGGPENVYEYTISYIGSLAYTDVTEIEIDASGLSGANSVAVYWDALDGAKGYRVYVGNAPSTYDGYFSVTSNSFVHKTLSGLTTGTPPESESASDNAGWKQLSPVEDTVVDLNDPAVIRALNHHSSIGQYIVASTNTLANGVYDVGPYIGIRALNNTAKIRIKNIDDELVTLTTREDVIVDFNDAEIRKTLNHHSAIGQWITSNA